MCSVHWHPEFLGAHSYPHCVLISRVFLRTPAPTLPQKKMCKMDKNPDFILILHMSWDSDRLDNLWLQTLYELWKFFKHSSKICRKYYKNEWF